MERFTNGPIILSILKTRQLSVTFVFSSHPVELSSEAFLKAGRFDFKKPTKVSSFKDSS